MLFKVYAAVSAASIVMLMYIKSAYRKSVEKRLESGRTHKEFRRLCIELRKEYAAIRKCHTPLQRLMMPPCTPELKRFSDGEFPKTLTVIRRMFTPVCIVQILFALYGMAKNAPIIMGIAAGIAAALAIMLIIYTIADRITMPHSKKSAKAKKEKKLNRWKYNTRQKRPYTAIEKEVVRTACIMRYGFAYPSLILLAGFRTYPVAAIISALLCIADGAFIQWHYRKRTHAFYCMMQDFMHQELTPFFHTPGFEKKAEKEGKFLGIFLISAGILCFICGVIGFI